MKRAAPGSAADMYFSQDVVLRIDKNTSEPDQQAIGMVWRVAGGESASTSDEEDWDDSDSSGASAERGKKAAVPEGHAEVSWMTKGAGKNASRSKPQNFTSVEELQVVDRMLVAGEAVASIEDPTGEMATVTKVTKVVDVELSDGRKLSQVPLSSLAPVHPFRCGHLILYKGWAARIREVFEQVMVKHSNGDVGLYVSNSHESSVWPANESDYYFQGKGTCSFFPGQKVVTQSVNEGFPDAHDTRNAKQKTRNGIVLCVYADEVSVEWITCVADKHLGMRACDLPVDIPASDCRPLDHAVLQSSQWHLGVRAVWIGEAAAPMAKDELDVEEGPSTPKMAAATSRKRDASQAASMSPLKSTSGDGSNKSSRTFYTLAAPNRLEPSAWTVKTASKIQGSLSFSSAKKKSKRRSHRLGRLKQEQEPESVVTAVITRTYTSADIVWQNGKVETGVPSTRLLLRVHTDDHDFFPEEFVQLAEDFLEDQAEPRIIAYMGYKQDVRYVRQVGVVRACDSKARTAQVVWLDRGGGEDDFSEPLKPPTPDSAIETVPVYKLQIHKDFFYYVGDTAVLLDQPIADDSDDGQGLDRIGEITGSSFGQLHLQTADGSERTVLPDKIVRIGGEEDDMSTLETDYMGSQHDGLLSSDSWRTCSADDEEANEAESMEDSDQDEKCPALRQLDFEDVPVGTEGTPRSDEPDILLDSEFAFPLPESSNLGSSPEGALDINYGSFAARGSGRRAASTIGPSPAQSVWGVANRLIGAVVGGWSGTPGAEDGPEDKEGGGVAEEKKDGEAREAETPEASIHEGQPIDDVPFAHFAVLEDCPQDHLLLQKAAAPVSKKFQKAVLKEWKLLESSLPSTIWVRAYESRMDLLRVVILAAADTPYAGHLFFFDMQLPPDYPAAPPVVLYHAWGLRVNPNLYQTGKVCLSLLGTWSGNRREMWSEESTLLQVVVSIQGLILVPKPYFNEAGFEKQSGSVYGEQNSVLYNEQAFLLTIKSALHLMRRPLAGFEDFAKAWYMQQREELIETCERFLDDSTGPASRTADDSGAVAREGNSQASAGFKLVLQELLPRYKAALQALQ